MKCRECHWQRIEFADTCHVISETVNPEHPACKWQQEYFSLLEEGNHYRDLAKKYEKTEQ